MGRNYGALQQQCPTDNLANNIMALVNCHECGNSVSDHAAACPKCGAPVIARIRRQRKAYLVVLGISLVFTAIMIFSVARLLNKIKDAVTPPPAGVHTTK
jgi:uncharacterized paraquat-inducible protein A